MLKHKKIILLFFLSLCLLKGFAQQFSVSATANLNPVCLGNSSQLNISVSGGATPYTYQWTSNPVGFNSTVQNPLVSPTVTTTYTVTVTDSTSQTASSSIIITVNSLPNVTVSATTNPVCAGNPTTLTAVGANTYSWSIGGTNQNATVFPTVTTTYTVTGTASNSCTNAASIVVNVNPKPNPSFTFTSNNVCANTPINFTNTTTGTGLTYQWIFGDPSSGAHNTSALANPSHTFSSAIGNGTENFDVSLTVTNSFNCSSVTTQTVTVNQIPDASLDDYNSNDPFTNCGGTLYDLIVTNISTTTSTNTNYDINWGDGSPNFTANNATWPYNTTTNHSYSNQGYFTITLSVTGQNGCIAINTYSVFNGSNPAVGLGNPGSTVNLCLPTSLTFPITGTTNNPPGTVYTITSNTGTPSAVFNHPPPAEYTHDFYSSSCGASGGNTPNSFYIRIRAENPCGFSESTVEPITTSIKPVADFSISPDTIVCINSTVTFTNISTSGISVNNYGVCDSTNRSNWIINPSTGWTIVNGALGHTNPTNNPNTWGSNILGLSFSVPGTYSISLITGNNCGNDTITKTICAQTPPTPNFTPSPLIGCAPLNVSIANNTVPVIYCSQQTYKWSVAYTPSNCGTQASYSYTNGTDSLSFEPSFLFNNPGTYTLTLAVTNKCGTFTTDRTVVVKDKPLLTLNSISDVCGLAIITPASNVVNCASNAITYAWTFTNGNPSSSNIQNPGGISFNTIGTHNISLNVTNECGTVTANTSFNIFPLPIVDAGLSDTICQGGSVSLYGTFGGSATGGIWSSSAGGTFTPSPNTLSAVWTPPSSFFGLATLTLTTTGMEPCSPASDIVNILVIPLPTVNAGNNQTLCAASTVNLAGTVGGAATGGIWTSSVGGSFSPNANTLNATWTPPPLFTGSATLTLTTTGMEPCPPVSDNINITILELATVDAGPPLSICVGENASLNGSVGGSATGGTWSSSAGGSFLPNANSLIATWVPPPSFTGTAILTFTTTGMSPCPPVSDTTSVVVNPAPVLSVNSPTICIGDNAVLTVSGADSYEWSNGNTTNTITVSPTTTTTYTVSGTSSSFSCSASISAIVTVKPLPTANAGSTQDVCQGSLVILNGSTGGSATGGTWSSSAGGTFTPNANTLNATWNPPSLYTGTAVLTLTTTGMSPCIETASNVNITVLHTPTVNAGLPDTICQGGTVSLNGTVGGSATGGTWTSSAGGSFSPNAITLNATWTPPAGYSGTAVLTLTTTGMAPCPPLTSNKQIVVKPTPTSNAGSPQTICETSSAFLSGNVGGSATGGTWTSSVGGTFNPNANTLNATWTPPALFIGSAILTLTTTGMSPCPPVSNAINIMVITFATVDAGPGNTICQGESVNLYGSVGGSATGGTWTSSAGGTFSPNANTLTATWTPPPSFTGTAILTLTTTGMSPCPPVTSNNSIIVNNYPVILVNSPAICYGDTVSLITSGGDSYLWSNGDTTNSITVSPFVTTTYTVTVSFNVTGCSNSASAIVTVNSLPVIDYSHDTLGCINLPVYFSNYTTGAVSYLWNFGNGSTSQSINPSNIYNSQGQYNISLIAYSVHNCVDSLHSNITIITPPVAGFSLTPHQGCAPFDVNITNTTIGENLTYYWDFGIPPPSASVGPFNITYPQGILDTSYVITLYTENICGNSQFVDSVFVHHKPTVDFGMIQPWACSPIPMKFINYSTGIANTLIWNFGDGSPEIILTSQNYVDTVNHTFYYYGTNDTTYTITLIGINNCGTDTIQKQLTVLPNEVIAFFSIDTILGCSPLTVNITNYSLGHTSSYWHFGVSGTSYNQDNSHNVSYSYSQPGNYIISLAVDNQCGHDTTYSNVITVKPNPFPTFSFNNNVCEGEAINFTNLSQDSINISWDFGDGVSSNLINPAHIFQSSGNYNVNLYVENTDGCPGDTTKVVTVKPLPGASFELPQDSGCSPFIVDFLNLTNAADSVFWDFGNGANSISPNPPNKTYYNSTYCSNTFYYASLIAHLNGCVDTSHKQITVHPNPLSAFSSIDSVYCDFGSQANKQFFEQSICADGYRWYLNNNEISSIASPLLTFPVSGLYDVSLVVKNHFNCIDSTSKKFTLYPDWKPTVNLSPTEGCEPLWVFYQGGIDSLNYIWSFGDGNTSTQVNNYHLYQNNGTYDVNVHVTGNGGCTDSLFLSNLINVFPTAKADFNFENVYENGTVLFTNTSYNADYFFWDFGDGNTYIGFDTMHRYLSDGYFDVFLYANNAYNCPDSIIKRILVDFFKGLYIPNAFSPYHPDHLVSNFKPIGIGLERYSIEIFDTWGNLIWSSTLLDEDGKPVEYWDGKSKTGKPLAMDVYVWKAAGIFKDGSIWPGMKYKNNVFKKYGTVTIIK